MVDSLLRALPLKHPVISFLAIVMTCNDALVNLLLTYYLLPASDNSSMRAEVTLVLKGGQLKKAMRDGGNDGRTAGRTEGGREGSMGRGRENG